ncbi:Kinesin-like protein [Drosera capensis]
MASSSSNQRSLAAKEKQPSARATLTSSSSSSSSSWNHSTSMQSKSVNGPPLQTSNRPKVPAKRSVTPNPRDHFNVDNDLIVRAKSPKRSYSNHSSKPHDQEPGRVRVSVRLRPRHVEDADYADCVELQPEMKKLKLRKNNWSSESFKFDEVFSETASQKRVYQVVAKPVVETVLSGFNGTVMAYGQTGTGKTYTVGNLGKNDASERGIMVRALEDIMANISTNDAVEVTYLQLYMESIHDLLSPNKVNIPIVEDSKTGEVSFPGAELVKVRDLDHFMELLQKAELNRHAANTKMNTNSSRSHAILMIYVRKPAIGVADVHFSSHELSKSVAGPGFAGVYTVRKSKLLIVDLAGSERIDKSGSEGQLLEEAKFINLSLTSLGKCINALAENSLHIPTRESKLTRILRDSFGGSARTSLIITIGPSERYHTETTSTIMFGQRAMKIVNMVKLKEEFDYESLSKKLEIQVDNLTREIDRQQKLRDNYINQMEKKLKECQLSFAEAEKSLVSRSEILEKENSCLEKEIKSILSELSDQKNFNKLLSDEVSRLEFSLEQCKLHQLESTRYQNKLLDTTQPYELRITELEKQLEDECAHRQRAKQDAESLKMLLSDQNSVQRKGEDDISKVREQLEENDQKKQTEINELQTKLAAILQSSEMTKNELESLRENYNTLSLEKEKVFGELDAVKQRLSIEAKHRAMLENELRMLKVLPESMADVEDKKLHMQQRLSRGSSSFRTTMGLHRSISGQRVTIAEFCEEVGLEKIVSLLSSEDVELQMQAAKVVANLAAEDADQEKIVNEGGLDSLLMLLQSSESIPILRAASGAIANLAMNETNQGLIMSKGGAEVLKITATRTDDLPTLRMIAGAFANLCGNVKLHRVLQREGCIKALLGMAESGNTEIIAQVARGFANFVKSETRQVNQGHGKGPSLLIKADALIWLINNTNISSDSTRRHIELALCHLAQNGYVNDVNIRQS